MQRITFLLPLALLTLSCVSEGERASVPPLPKGGAALPYAEVLSRLSVQTRAARDEHFLNNWEQLAKVAMDIEFSAAYLPKAPDIPPRRQPTIQQETSILVGNARELQTSAKAKNEAQSLEMIRRIHNQIRDLQEEPR